LNRSVSRNTLLEIPLIEERYGRFFFISIAFHGLFILLILFGGYLLPSKMIQIGDGGHGEGEKGGGIPTVGIGNLPSDLRAYGDGLIKPPLNPPPPAPTREHRVEKANSIRIPGPSQLKGKTKPVPEAATNIPKDRQLGIGGNPGNNSGSGGGSGGGNGVFIGPGLGGIGDDWYSRQIGPRISQHWIHPADGKHIEMVYSFYISANGTLYEIKKEKSSGNESIDLTAEQALFRTYNPDPLPPPPVELRGRKLTVIFSYPSNP
jgi:hypothetical protein